MGMCLTFAGGTIAQDIDHKKLPPISMLPKEGEAPKRIYQFPHETNYRLLNASGKELATGETEFLDMTDYKDGVYYMEYTKLDGENILDKFTKETVPAIKN